MKSHLRLALSALLLSIAVSAAPAATLSVITTADSGPGSLRQALEDANADATPNLVTITFNIPGAGVRTISPLTELPVLTRSVTMDGYTQPGTSLNTLSNADNAVLRIELSGASAGAATHALRLAASGCTVRGLVINGFTNGTAILVEIFGGNVMEGNFIGTDATGTNARPNATAIEIRGAGGNRIGGLTPASRNIVSGNNYFGIGLSGVSNQVLGNFIGLGADGTTALPNGGWGLYLDNCSLTQIGGPTPGARNLIAATPNGCWISGGVSNVLQGNFVGTDASGTLARGNLSGVVLDSSSHNLIGGTEAGAGNLISGNGSGVAIVGVGSTNNVLAGNLIGTDVTGTLALGNVDYGVLIYGHSGNLIGGTSPGAGNVISATTLVGVAILGSSASNNVVAGNLIGTDVTGTNRLGNGTGIFVSESPGVRIGGLTPGSRNIISGNEYGISLNVVVGTVILGNYVGLGSDGVTAVSNINSGISLHYCTQTQIGGTAPGARNVISANAGGCYFNVGGSNVIQGNYFGTDFSGTLPRGNTAGLTLNESSHNLIGGAEAGAGNLISACSGPALSISGLNASNNIVAGNLLGTDAAGTASLGNGDYGVLISSAPGNVIGGIVAGARNVIVANLYAGIAILYAGANGNVVQGNLLGTDSSGSLAISNRQFGVLIYVASGNLIGGTADGAGNGIAFSAFAGVASSEDSATNNAVLGNSIRAIGGPGLDFGGDGLTPNDSGDADGGPNRLQNFPENLAVVLSNGTLVLSYRVDSAPANSAYPFTVEFFLADPNGSGRTFVRRHTYDTPQTVTNIHFTPAMPVNEGDTLVATATDANGNTSEFSPPAIASPNHPPVVASAIPDRSGTSGAPFTFTFEAGTFTDPDPTQTLTYIATGQPPGVTFDGPTRTFNGPLTSPGLFTITVTATDNGLPPMSVSDTFDLTVVRASFIVTNLANSGAGTLRQAIADALPGDTIEFAVTGTLLLLDHLEINKSLTIAGPGATNLVIRGNDSRLFNVSAGPTVISGLTLSAGLDWYEAPRGGGAIYNSAHLTLNSCEFSHNESITGGGAVWNGGAGATLIAVGCTFFDNSMPGGSGDGGGALWSDNVLRITNCTFWDNYSVNNGGAVRSSGDAAIASSTLVGNRADFGSGGGVFNGGGMLALQNSILSGNDTFFGFAREEVGGSITSGDYNLINYTNNLVVPGTHNVLGQDPILSPLKDHGGPTRTLGLASTSPAVDAAEGATSPAADQRGMPRPQGSGYDIGAFEGALPPNTRPSVAHPIPDQFSTYQAPFSFVIPANTFNEPDAGQTLTYSVAGLPPDLSFNAATRTISGNFRTAGTNPVVVIVRDDGAPPLSTNATFNLIAPKVPITARADDASRIIGQFDPFFTITYYGLAPGDEPNVINNPPFATTTATSESPPGTYPIQISGGSDDVYDIVGWTNGTLTVTLWPLRAVAANASRGVGQGNPPLVGVLTGVLFGDNITATYTSASTPASPAGDYPITPLLHDPDGRLTNYDVTLVNGALTVESDALSPDLQVLHWFGFTNRIGSTAGELIEGSDGWLYGTGGGLGGMGVFKIQKSGAGFIVVRMFTAAEGAPSGALLEAAGILYGASANRVWAMNLDGTGFTVLHVFGSIPNDGTGGVGGLIKASDGMLYGATQSGGEHNGGTVFRLHPNGTGYGVLHSFALPLFTEGARPSALVEGSDGALYGTTESGGLNDPGFNYFGTVFKVSKNGLGFTLLHTFTNGTADGVIPRCRLLASGDGLLYGTTYAGGTGHGGTIFRLREDGTEYGVLKSFERFGNAGDGLFAPLIQGSDGLLYGTTSQYGPTSYGGTVFRLQEDGTDFTVIKQFADSNGDVWGCRFGLLEAADGTLYGAASQGGNLEYNSISGGVFMLKKDGSDYALLYPFSRTGGDGRGSVARATEGSDGMIYGTTRFGGTRDIGTVFRMNKDGSTYAVLHSFSGATNDGSHPVAEVIEASDGRIYGTTLDGGTNLAGTLFRMNKDGSGYAVLKSFEGSDGSAPSGGLVEGSDHKLYGCTSAGGAFYSGTLFRMNLDGTGFATMLTFDGTNGWSPECTLIEDAAGMLYGTTSGSYGGQGTVFQIHRNGSAFTNLHAFDVAAGESIQPVGGLLLASDGVLYGTASDRHAHPRFGAVFKLNRDGTGFQTLHTFGLTEMDGRYPSGVLSEGADGRIYGVTSSGGVFQSFWPPHSGTIFRLRKDGSGYSVLHHFGSPSSPGGSFLPVDGKGALFRGSDGSLYALSPNGDPLDFGFVYRLVFPSNLPPLLDFPIANQTGTYGSPFSFTFPANTFRNTEAGQTLSYTAGSLPPGITFNGLSRAFSGTLGASGTFAVTVTATDNGTPSLAANDSFDIVVAKAPLITTAAHQSRLPGQANPPLTGTLVGVTNSDNLTVTFESAAMPASPPGAYLITPVFSDPNTRLPNYVVTTNTGILTVLNCASLSITNAVLSSASRGVPYSVTLRAANGGSPYSFAITGGALPGSLSLAAGGLLSGTATAVGNYSFTVTATDGLGCMVSSNYNLAVVCPSLSLSPGTLPGTLKDAAYSITFTTANGTAPYAYAVTGGVLPGGLTLASGGLLSGAATNGGNFAFTVRSTDAGGCTVSSNYSVTVEAPVYEGFAYAEGAALHGQNGGTGLSNAWSGPSSFVIVPGSFGSGPVSGGHLQPGEGTITRRLSEPIGTPGTTRYLSIDIRIVFFSPPFGPPDRFGVLLNGAGGAGLFVGKPGSGNGNWHLEDAAGGGSIAGPPQGQFGGRLVIKCEFFSGNDRFTLYANPVAGQPEPASGTVKFNSDAGTLTNIAFTVAGNGIGLASFDELRLVSTWAAAVPSCPTISVNPASLPNGLPGKPYGASFSASGGTAPHTFSRIGGTLPAGLALTDGGLLSGTPTSGGNYSFTIAATDAIGCSGTRSYTMNLPGAIVLANPTMLPDGSFRFGFANTPGVTFTALATTNVALSLGNWTELGPVTEVSPGQFQFQDPQATSLRRRFYNVRSP